MTLFKRRLLYLTFFLLFAVFAPAILLFANGYRVDWGRLEFYKTGLLIVEYLPKDALLRIDDTIVATRSPKRVSGLTPRTYTLRIEKDGSVPWEKRLWVPEYAATFVRHVTLFKQSLPAHMDMLLERFAPHPKEQLVAVARANEIGFRVQRMSPNGAAPIPDLPIFSDIDSLSWSRGGNWLLVQGKSGGRTLARVVPTTGNAPILALESIVAQPLARLTWDATNDHQLAGYTKTGKGTILSVINVETASVQQAILPDQSFGLPFVLDGDRLVVMTTNQTNETTLIFRPITPSPRSIEQHVTIPSVGGDLRFLDTQDHLLTLLDTRTGAAYLVEREPRTTPPVIETFSNVKGGQWSPNGHRLIYWNEQEVFLWDLERNTKERIYRSENPLQRVFWHPNNEYVFVQTKKTIGVLEIDGRDQRNFVTLANLQLIGDAAIDTKGQWLAVWDTFSATTGIDWYEIK